MLMKAWLSALQRQFVRGSRGVGLKARRREVRSDHSRDAERLEERALLTALVITSENFGDFSNPNEGLKIGNAQMVGFDSLVIESVGFGGVNDAGIEIDLSGINLRGIAIENVSIADYGTIGIDIALDAVTGLETIAIEDTQVLGDGVGVQIALSNDTDVDGLTIDDDNLAGVHIVADSGSDIAHGAIMESRLVGGVGVQGILLEMDQSNADNFNIINNTRISSSTSDAVLLNFNDAPQDGITIRGNEIGAVAPVDIEFVVDGDTFTQPFRFTNLAANGEFVTRMFIDIAPAELQFDEDPTTGKPFQALAGSDVVTGLSGALTTPSTLDMTFLDFAPGEEIVWEIDLDLAGGTEASVNGADMIGSRITFEFSDGKVISGVLIGVPGQSDAARFSQTAGSTGANGIHVQADASPVTNITIEDNNVSGTPGSSLIFDTFDHSDVTGTIQNNNFVSAGTDGVVFNMTDGDFQGGFLNNNVSGNAGHGLLFNPVVSRSGQVERVSRGTGDSIVITTANHDLQTGDEIVLQGLVDDDPNVIYPANGVFTVTRVSNDRFQLDGTAGMFSSFTYDSGGSWYLPDFQPDGSARGLVSLDLKSELPGGFVQDASNTNPIVITSRGHGLTTGDLVRIRNVNGNTAANGVRTISVLDADRFQLNGVAGNGVFDPDQGLGQWVGNVITDATNTGEIVITAPAHSLSSGDRVRITGVLGNTAANGTHTVRRIDDNSFKLVGVAGNGDYLGDGNWLALKQTTSTGDRLEQMISGNSFTSNAGAGLQVNLTVGTAFNADAVRNQFVQNRDTGLNIQTTSFGVGAGLPLDPQDLSAVPDDSDISFDVSIGSVNADDGNVFDLNDKAGIRLQALDAGTGSFEIRNNLIKSTQDVGDPLFAGDGIHVRLEGLQAASEAVAVLATSVIDANVIGVDAEGNEGRGVVFSMEERTRIQDLEYTNNSVVNNGGDGFKFIRRDDARLNNVRVTKNTFENNTGDGADFTAQNTTGSDPLDFRFDENDITNNTEYGIRISVLADAEIQVDLENNSIDFNGRNENGFHPNDGLGNQGAAGGIGFLGFQNVQVEMNMTGNRVNNNVGDGLSMDAVNFFDVLRVTGDWRDNEFTGNSLTGVRQQGVAFGRFNWTDNTFSTNGEDGVRAVTVIDPADFFDRRVGGNDISIAGIGNRFEDNAANGLHLGQGISASFGDGSVENANYFSNNGEDGFKITQGAGTYLFEIGHRRAISAHNNFFENNGDSGIDIGEYFVTEGGNLLHGDEVVTQTDLDFVNVVVANNGADGIEYLADNVPEILPVVGGGQDNTNYFFDAYSSLNVRDSTIRRNGQRGIDVLNRVSEDSRISIVNNNINSNTWSGVYILNSNAHDQLQNSPDDPLVASLDTIYPFIRDDQTPTGIFAWEGSPFLELRIQDNEIQSNGSGNPVQSRVPINSSSAAGDGGAVRTLDWTHRTGLVNGTLGGLVVRVGSVDAPDLLTFAPMASDPDIELGFYASVDAEVFRNSFDGNFGSEVYFDNFTSVVPPELLGNFSCQSNPRVAYQVGNSYRDPVSRFDLVFRENQGTGLDAINGFSFVDEVDILFKNRDASHQGTQQDGVFPTGGPNRKRNQTRISGLDGFSDFETFICEDDQPPTVLDVWSYDGAGPSAWRVESDLDSGGFTQTDTNLGYSDFNDQVQLGLGFFELPYEWDTGGNAWSLDRGDVFNVRTGEDPIQADSLEENDTFVAATNLGNLGGAVSVNGLADGNLLTIDVKGDRDYYEFIPNGSGVLSVSLAAVDTNGDALDFELFEFDPTADTEEVSHPRTSGFSGPVTVTPGGASTRTYNVTAGRTYYIKISSLEDSNQGFTAKSYVYGTARAYLLDLDVPDGAGSSSGGGGSGNSSGGSGRGSQPGAPRAEVEPVTPDPRSTGVPKVEITFTEDVVNVDITDFTLTRDGSDIDISDRTVVMVTPSDYTLDLSGVTQEAGTYKLVLRRSDITDVDDNPLQANASDTWEVINQVSSQLDIPDSEPGDGDASDDDGNSTLRAAVQEANAVAGEDIVNLGAGTFLLTREGTFEEAALLGDLDVTDDLRIVGAGADVTIIDAGGLDRIFHVYPGVTLYLEGLTLTNGEAHDGGAVFNEGVLELHGVNIADSRAFNQGGGIYNVGDIFAEDSAIVRNSAGSRGGGIFNSGNVFAVNTTVSTNTSLSRGAGIFNAGDVELRNVTVALNDGGARGGGVANETGFSTVLANTLIATNQSDFISASAGGVQAHDFEGDAQSAGFNLIGELNSTINRIGGGWQGSDLLGGTTELNAAIDPLLAPLTQAVGFGRNGTFRHNLKQSSPAIDAGKDSLYPTIVAKTDQVGQPRILDGDLDAEKRIDIGAKERFLNRPVATFTISSNPAGINERVNFDGSGSSHTNDAQFNIVSWEWDFDYDGTTFTVDATGQNADNRYPVAGTFTVALRVTDNNVPPKTDLVTQTLVIGVRPGAPTLVRPVSVTSDSTPVVRWESGAPKFDLRLRRVEADGSMPVIISETNLPANEYTVRVADRLTPGSYAVEVRGVNETGAGPWSDLRNFRVKQVLLRSPLGKEYDPTPELQWTGVSNSLRYELFIKDQDTGIVVYRVTNLPGDSNVHTVPVELPVGRYLYRVTAFDRDDSPGDKSAPRRFKIVTPIVQSPAGVTVDPTPEIVWTDVQAPFYEVQIVDPANGNVVFQQNGIAGTSIVAPALANGDYRVRVRAEKASGEVGHFSPAVDFRVDTNHVLNLVSPIGDTADRTPLFDWDGVDGVRRYEFRISRIGTIFRENNVADSEFQLPDANKLDSGSYKWFVRAVGDDGDFTPWSTAAFDVVQPVVTAPAGTVQTRTPQIEWQGSTVFTSYELRVDNVTLSRNNVIRERDITGTTFTPTLPLEDGVFRVRVRGEDAEGNLSAWSDPFDFTINLGVGQGPQLLSPTSGLFTGRSPTFVWTEVSNATPLFTYELVIKEVRTSGQPILLEIKGIQDGQLGDNRVQHQLAEVLPSGRRFRWWVRAVNADGEPGPYSAPDEFRTVSVEQSAVPQDQSLTPDALPAAPMFVEDGTMVASLTDEITIHPALAAEQAVVHTTASVRTSEPEKQKAVPAVSETVSETTPLEAPAQVDSVMATWVGGDWCEDAAVTATPAAPAAPDAEGLSGETDGRMLLAAALPMLFGRRRNRDKKSL